MNTSPLIFLAKLDRLDLLARPCGTTPDVLDEVRTGGDQGQAELLLIDGLVRSGDLVVVEPKRTQLDAAVRLGRGEASVIRLTMERGIEEVVLDDRIAIRVAKMLDLKPISTAFLLLRARREETLTAAAYRGLLERLVGHGYFLSAPLYQRLVQAGEP